MKKSYLLMAGLALIFSSCTTDSFETLDENGANLKGSLNSNLVIIDFEEYEAGDFVSEMSPDGCAGTIDIFGLNPESSAPNTNAAMIFDSSNPTGGDLDLGSPNQAFGGPGQSEDGDQPSNDSALGNVLIITENFDTTDPDDSYVEGSLYHFDFSGYGNGEVTMVGFDMLDLDAPGANGALTVVRLYDVFHNLLFEKTLDYAPDNAKQYIDLEETQGVTRMVIELNNSGAIDNIKFRCAGFEAGQCDTMFAKDTSGSDRCFDQDGFSRWGWTNGPFTEGTYFLDLYAGAGQCDTSKGELVGVVIVEYSGSTVEVSYQSLGGHVFTETHLYVGKNPYPQKRKGKKYVNTVAPGQFPYKNDGLGNVLMDSYTIHDVEGPIWVIAHGVACQTDNLRIPI